MNNEINNFENDSKKRAASTQVKINYPLNIFIFLAHVILR